MAVSLFPLSVDGRQTRFSRIHRETAAFNLQLKFRHRLRRKRILIFHSPSQVSSSEAPDDRPFRTGGLVKVGSVTRNSQSLAVQFVLNDTLHEILVNYDGILPDLFREGQGIVANGRLAADGSFTATEVLAKHDENYMPPELADALAKAGAQYSQGKYRQVK